MDIRYSCNQKDFKRYTTEEMRDEMLITGLYKADEVVAVYSHVGPWSRWAVCRCTRPCPSTRHRHGKLRHPTISWSAARSVYVQHRQGFHRYRGG